MYIKIFFLCLIFKLICCDNIAQRLIDRYNDVKMECFDSRNKAKPAYECSGLMIRGLANIGGVKQKYAWSKKETNKRKNAFSAAFLRKDQRFNTFAHGYDSGFIYYPHLKTPSGKNKYPVYCAFPVSAHTDYRGGEHTCGQYNKDKTGKSGNCDAQGITSLTTWTRHFEDVTRGQGNDFEFGKWQCGFDLNNKDKARYFAVALEAKTHLRHSRKYSWYHNEIIIRAWNEDHPEKLPIEAFYYLIGYSSGEDKAIMYQRDYLDLTGETIPVVGIRLPQIDDPKLIVEYEGKKYTSL